MTRALPPSASFAHLTEGDKLHAPAAERNRDAICALVQEHAATKGTALEIASGTGQHIVALAKALPHLTWQPTDIDPARRASINAHLAEAGLSNAKDAIGLDATAPGWSEQYDHQSLILLVNLLHLIPTADAKTLIFEVARALTPGGTFIFYGPFRRDGELTSPGDVRFDAELRGADPQIGYKDTRDIATWLNDAHLTIEARVEMPANNLAFVARKPE